MRISTMDWLRLIPWVVVSLLAPRALGQAPDSSAQKEIALGRSLAADIERRYRPLADAVVADRVRELAGKLARLAGMTGPLTIRLVEIEEPVASALPGGFLVLSSGLIRRMETASELAGVVAHEMAHIAARHGVRPATRNAAAPVVFMGGWDGVCTRVAAAPVVPRGSHSIALEQERQADELALGWLREAGLDPAGLASGFKRLRP